MTISPCWMNGKSIFNYIAFLFYSMQFSEQSVCRFDNMLMEYDDEELGDLEECEEEEIQGCSDLREFSEEMGELVDDLKAKGYRAVVRDNDVNIIAQKDEDVIAITKQLEAAYIKGTQKGQDVSCGT